MEQKSKKLTLKTILIAMTIGIWAIVLQNAGIIPTKQNVYVKGGYIDADVSGRVDINNTVDVSGSVSVDNEVDVNLEAINGKHSVFYDFNGNGDHYRIPVYTGR
jgi:hypothetical protein